MANERQVERGLRLLALDGGGIRGVSELIILKELMLGMQKEQMLSVTPKPCEVFDLIGGTSTGGLIAILLGRLQLSVDEALDEYGQLCEKTFSKKKTWGKDGQFSATQFEATVKDIVQRYGNRAGGADPNLRLVDESLQHGGCKVFVCTRSRRSLNTPRLFKSYGPFRSGDYPDLMIWQAARATSAAPRLFKHMLIGRKGAEEELIDGGVGANNPTKLLMKDVTQIYDARRRISCIISVGCGEKSIIEYQTPSFFQKLLPLELIKALKRIVTDCKTTAQEVGEKFRDMQGVYFRFNVDQGLQDVGLQEWRELGAITSRTISYLDGIGHIVALAVRKLVAPESATSCTVADLEFAIHLPSMPISLSQLAIESPDVPEQSESQRLQHLHESLAYDGMQSREADIKRKAEDAREDAFNWVLADDKANGYRDAQTTAMISTFRTWIRGDGSFFWISGKAASGKSTLMRKLYHDPRLLDYLCCWTPPEHVIRAHMFFSNDGPELQKSREGLLRSLLHQVLEEPDLRTDILRPYLHKIPPNARRPPDILWTWIELRDMFQKLLGQATNDRRFCFFIDGLDEYNVLGATYAHPPGYYLHIDSEQGRTLRAGYLELARMLRQAARTDYVKICASSRPLNEFGKAFVGLPTLQLELLTRTDIECFVQGKIRECCIPYEEEDYQACIEEVISKAQGVFLWVRIATGIIVDRIISGDTPEELWNDIHTLPPELGGSDGLYMRILQNLGSDHLAKATRMFDLVSHARHEMTLLMLSFAMEVAEPAAIQMMISPLSSSKIAVISARMERKLKSCGGLLETYEHTQKRRRPLANDAHINRFPSIRFMHLTFDEFLLWPNVQELLRTLAHPPSTDVNVALLIACLLRLKHIGITSDYLDLWGAIKDGLYYAAQAEKTTGRAQSALLDDMDRTVEQLLRPCLLNYRLYGSLGDHESIFLKNFDYSLKQQHIDGHHWASYEPQDVAYGKIHTRHDNFESLAVQANLVLYIRSKGCQKLPKVPGRPLLAYAVVPTPLRTKMQYEKRSPDFLGSGFSALEMTRLLLDNGANPNEFYEEGEHRWSITGGAWPAQSVWQWALSVAFEHYSAQLINLGTHRQLWDWDHWHSSMQVLVEYGANPNATVLYHKPRRRRTQPHAFSALLLCSILERNCIKNDNSLVNLLVDRGGKLAEADLSDEGELHNRFGISYSELKSWSRYKSTKLDRDKRRLTA